MNARSVKNRIGVNLNSLGLPISETEVFSILRDRNIKPINISISLLAKKLIHNSNWKLGARQWEAPNLFDCSSLTKWLYGQMGIWLPRRPLQQLEFCERYGSEHELNEIIEGDILFISSPYKSGTRIESYTKGIHVCISIGNDEVISATNSELGTGIVKISITDLLKTREFRSVGRVCRDLSKITTFEFPSDREVETVDDIRWIILQSL